MVEGRCFVAAVMLDGSLHGPVNEVSIVDTQGFNFNKVFGKVPGWVGRPFRSGVDEVMLIGKKRGRRGKDARSGKNSAHFLQKYDANNDGTVTKEEFKHERRFAEIDADSDGVLSKTEIEEAMDKRLRESDIGFFERFDLNGDGKVTREEFTGAAADFEAKDSNNDGVIDAADKVK